jgi:hypothetical protein
MIEPPSFNRGKAFWTVKNAFVEEASAAAFVIGFIFFPVEISTGRPHGQDHAKPRLVGHHFSIIFLRLFQWNRFNLRCNSLKSAKRRGVFMPC